MLFSYLIEERLLRTDAVNSLSPSRNSLICGGAVREEQLKVIVNVIIIVAGCISTCP